MIPSNGPNSQSSGRIIGAQVAQLGITAGTAAIMAAFPVAGIFAAVAGGLISSVIGNLIMGKPKTTQVLADIPQTTLGEGEPATLSWGRYVRVPGHVLWTSIPRTDQNVVGSTKRGYRVTATTYSDVIIGVSARPSIIEEIYGNTLTVYRRDPTFNATYNYDDQIVFVYDQPIGVRPTLNSPMFLTRWWLRIQSAKDAQGRPKSSAVNLSGIRAGALVRVTVTRGGNVERSFKNISLGPTTTTPPYTGTSVDIIADYVVIDSRVTDQFNNTELILNMVYPGAYFERFSRPVGFTGNADDIYNTALNGRFRPFPEPIAAGVPVGIEVLDEVWNPGIIDRPYADNSEFRLGLIDADDQPFLNLVRETIPPADQIRFPGIALVGLRQANRSKGSTRSLNWSFWIDSYREATPTEGLTTQGFIESLLDEYSNIPTENYDVTDLEDHRNNNTTDGQQDWKYLDGYRAKGNLKLAEILFPVRAAKEVIIRESDGILKFSHSNQRDIDLLDDDFLILDDNASAAEHPIRLTNIPDSQLSQTITIQFTDRGDRLTQSSARVSRDSLQPRLGPRNDQLFNFTDITMTRTEANNIAERFSRNIRRRRFSVYAETSLAYAYIRPEDELYFINPNEEGEVVGVLVTKVEVGSDYQVKIEGLGFHPDSAQAPAVDLNLTNSLTSFNSTIEDRESNVEESPLQLQLNQNTQSNLNTPPMELYAIDVAAFSDEHIYSTGFYFAVAANPLAADPGVTGFIYCKSDTDTEFREVVQVERFSTVGSALTALATVADVTVIDNVNTVQVTLDPEVNLFSVTQAEMLAGANVAYLGGEMIQYTTATAISAGVWELSGLLRGQYSTEDVVGDHIIGEAFVFFGHRDDAPWNLVYVPTPLNSIGKTFTYRVEPGFDVLDIEDDFPHTIQARAGRPYKPNNLSAVRQVNDDIILSWSRVSRAQSDGVTVVGEVEYETSFRVTVTGTTREYITPNLTITYTEAEQIADGTLGSTVEFNISQISPVTGDGPATTISV